MALPRTRYSPEEYLALERKASSKSEYIDGQIYAMAGASEAHNLIMLNTASEIRAFLKNKPCRTYNGDMRVQIAATSTYTYPDVVVVCDKPIFADTNFDTVINPAIIVEVLSPSTAGYDRGAKFMSYRRVPTLTEYILINQDRPVIEHYQRQDQRWILTEIEGLDSNLPLFSIGAEISLRDIYDKVDFPEVVDEENPEAGIFRMGT